MKNSISYHLKFNNLNIQVLIGDFQLLCSQVTNVPEFDPAWIALNHGFKYYIIFELESPWNKKVELGENFPQEWNDVLNKAKENGIKVKFLLKEPSSDSLRKLFIYELVNEPYIKLIPHIFNVPHEKVVEVLNGILTGDFSAFEEFREKKQFRDIFMCIHANRDQCCGRFGAEMVEKLKSVASPVSSIRVWKCSHLGGHRMAPTFMEMPYGRFWGFVKEKELANLLFHTGDHLSVVRNYRGSMGSDKLSQIAEKELFNFYGWDWFNMEKKVISVSDEGPFKRVTLQFTNGKVVRKADVLLEEGKMLIFPASECDEGKEIRQYYITSVDIRV